MNIHIWSAACSTGQEVYNIAIVLKELSLVGGRFNIKLLGADISDAAVARASYGTYNNFEIHGGLPKEKLTQYFTQNGDSCRVRDELRAQVTFRKANLIEDFSGLGKFDIIFCRNVAIYFTEEDRVNLFRRIGNLLELEGYLIIGPTESLTGICPQFEPKRQIRSVFLPTKRE